jgi:hypothetical protein
MQIIEEKGRVIRERKGTMVGWKIINVGGETEGKGAIGRENGSNYKICKWEGYSFRIWRVV